MTHACEASRTGSSSRSLETFKNHSDGPWRIPMLLVKPRRRLGSAGRAEPTRSARPRPTAQGFAQHPTSLNALRIKNPRSSPTTPGCALIARRANFPFAFRSARFIVTRCRSSWDISDLEAVRPENSGRDGALRCPRRVQRRNSVRCPWLRGHAEGRTFRA